eukprot:GILJ01002042.1.p1 GENE.GILJ01002042.1~~GILJ01002042.1.p1  ORF type:complete len:371 (-),score=27.96 GILJ01002042.1:201-1313(-)
MGQSISLDLGGLIAKVVYFQPDNSPRKLSVSASNPITDTIGVDGDENTNLGFHSRALGGTFHFMQFQFRHIETFLEHEDSAHLRKALQSCQSGNSDCCPISVRATGSGAHKLAPFVENRFNIVLERQREIKCIIRGLDFLLKSFPRECYSFVSPESTIQNPAARISHETRQAMQKEYFPQDEPHYPYLLVNVRTGLSMYKVESATSYTRVSGSTVGGATFWGLCRLLTNFKTPEEAIASAASGDNTCCDMTVGDIYGGDCSALGLGSDIVASSFGKMKENGHDVSEADIVNSLLTMISFNVTQLAYFNAVIHKLPRIFFAGHQLDSPQFMEKIQFSIHFWSGGEMKALFLKHASYLAAVGAFLDGTDNNV